MNGIWYARCWEENPKHENGEKFADFRDTRNFCVSEAELVKAMPGIEIFGGSIRTAPVGQPSENQIVKIQISDNGTWCPIYKFESENLPYRNVGRFNWAWSGNGTSEHWFDDSAVVLAKVSDYRSNSGLTANSARVVAYCQHVEVGSHFESQKNVIQGESINRNLRTAHAYRGDWTGPAFYFDGSGKVRLATADLDELIAIKLQEKPWPSYTTCRHNRTVEVGVVGATTPKETSYLLCRGCRTQGVRWNEFTARNQQDLCPYFKRACKSVTEKTESFPEWFKWTKENLLSVTRRLNDGGRSAYEVTYLRGRDKFVRRMVVLLDNDNKIAWGMPYQGYILSTYQEFEKKYPVEKRRQLQINSW